MSAWRQHLFSQLQSLPLLAMAPSQTLLQWYQVHFPLHTMVLQQNYYSPRPENTAASKPRTAGPTLLYLGGDRSHKGAEVLRAALQQIPGSCQFTLLAPEFTSDDPRVVRLPRLGFAAIDRLYQAVDGVLIPSLWPENSPYALGEAVQSGKQVLAAAIGGLAEYRWLHGQISLCRPGDAAGLARGLQSMVSSMADFSEHGLASAPSSNALAEHLDRYRQAAALLDSARRFGKAKPSLLS